MLESYEGYRLLLVHAHPDDETINNGSTMALYADLGARVTGRAQCDVLAE